MAYLESPPAAAAAAAAAVVVVVAAAAAAAMLVCSVKLVMKGWDMFYSRSKFNAIESTNS